MNFFQHQDDARRKSSRLVFLLGLAVIALIAITTVILGGVFYFIEGYTSGFNTKGSSNGTLAQHLYRVITSGLVIWIAAGVTSVVALGSLYKSAQLKQGGDYVAQMLGGKILLKNSTHSEEQTLLNIVDEMAIASGMPIPRVYLLENGGINAFAAGNTSSNAVIGITKACIQTLNREQLQGVIAHEFSHIHHGDMRLNLRLVAILHGILLIGLIGEMLFRGGLFNRRKKKGNSGAVVGLALMAVGFSGVFFGNAIKAAVSRQREFLADASAVQYTRNPQGIAEALLMIKKSVCGSTLQSEHASEFSHLFFAKGVRSFFGNMFSTHPPLDERISRVYKHKIDDLEKKFENAQTISEHSNDSQSATEPHDGVEKKQTENTLDILDRHINSIGMIEVGAIAYSHTLLSKIPVSLLEACANPYQARAIVYALILDSNEDIRSVQIDFLKKRAHPATFKEFLKINKSIQSLDETLRFPLLQLAQPALLNASESQKTLFINNLNALAKEDHKITLKEWVVLIYIQSAYDEQVVSRSERVDALKAEIKTILAFASQLNKKDQQQNSLNAGINHIWPNEKKDTPIDISLTQLNASLDRLKRLNPMQVPMLLKAIFRCMAYDGVISVREKEVLRTLSAVFDAPMPIIDS